MYFTEVFWGKKTILVGCFYMELSGSEKFGFVFSKWTYFDSFGYFDSKIAILISKAVYCLFSLIYSVAHFPSCSLPVVFVAGDLGLMLQPV
jgi:hypothetical protein